MTPDMRNWTPEQQAEYMAACEDLAEERAAIAAIEGAEKAERESPERLIAARREDARKAREQREAKERDRKDAAAWEELKAKHGEKRLARVLTERGMLVFAAPSADDVDAHDIRLVSLQSHADRTGLNRGFTRDYLRYPSREEFDSIVREYPLLWPHIIMAHDELLVGIRRDVEKKG